MIVEVAVVDRNLSTLKSGHKDSPSIARVVLVVIAMHPKSVETALFVKETTNKEGLEDTHDEKEDHLEG